MTTATTTQTVACRVCGVATDLNIEVRYGRTPAGMRDVSGDYAVGTCEKCQTLDNSEPGSAVRACLRVIGKDEADWPTFDKVLQRMEVDPLDVMFGHVGQPWQGPQRRAWRHVTGRTKSTLKVAHTRMLLDRAAPPEPDVLTPPPADGPQGCLACGVALATAWHGPLITSGALRGDGQRLDGYLCPVCVVALEEVGAVGMPFLQKAIERAKGSDFVASRLRAWVATGIDPRDEAWDWVDSKTPALELDPITALLEMVADLTDRLERLEGHAS